MKAAAPGRPLRALVLVILTITILLPILAGFWQTARAAFGLLPALGATNLSLAPFHRLATLPGLATSLRLTLTTGFAATLLSLALAIAFAAAFHARLSPHRAARLLAPFLATPHAAMAIGLGFLIAPSGWLARLVSPWLTGWTLPPDLVTTHDPYGLALTLALTVKETPFLLLVTLSALTQLPVRSHLATARALGYSRAAAWAKLILPQLYPLIRLPLYVTLAFSLSVVDVALILGPSNPPTLAVAILRWSTSPEVTRLLPAAAASLLQTAIVAAAIALWFLAERLTIRLARPWIARGARRLPAEPLLRAGAALAILLFALGALALVTLLLWSLTWRWSFPHALPQSWSLRTWAHPLASWGPPLAATAEIALATTILSLALAIAWLEGEDRGGIGRLRRATALIYLPLLTPQIGFLFGLNTAFLRAGLTPGMTSVIWAQSLFVFPYVMIALSDPWRALDRRLIASAAALGASPLRRLLAVKLPILLRPILTAAAIGAAVSVAQYLPTLFMGAGRVDTLTTEAVSLSSGADRRITGTYALLQAALPFIAYALAIALPPLLQRNRRALSGGLTS